MSRTVSRTLTRLYLEQHLRGGRWLAGALAFGIAFPALALADRDWFGGWQTGVMIGLLLALNYGIANDRRTGFDRFMINTASAITILRLKVLVTAALCTGFLLLGFVVAAVAWRSPQLALWYSTRVALFVGLLLPLTLLVEITVGTNIPGLVAGLTSFLLLIVGLTRYKQPFIDFIGFDFVTGSYASLQRLFLVTIVWNVILAVGACSVWLYQHRRGAIRSSQ